jgi:hypothetical protein
MILLIIEWQKVPTMKFAAPIPSSTEHFSISLSDNSPEKINIIK